MSDKDTNLVLNEVILGYRLVIKERYQFDNLNSKYELPASFDESRINQFRNYFLEYIYPHPAQRRALDDAFDQLDNYIQQPKKLLRLLMDSVGLVFKYGRHLPKILMTGLKALGSFRAATKFEGRLVEKTAILQLTPPFSVVQINQLIKALSKEELEQFIDTSLELFETLHDRVLVKKILEIVEYLISKMKKRPTVYSKEEVKGLEIGRDIIKYGDNLFSQLPKADQVSIFKLIVQIEREVLEDLFRDDEIKD